MKNITALYRLNENHAGEHAHRKYQFIKVI